nr:Gag-Pol polyprotein [Tanacetum cinerariifolium]
MWSDQEKKIQKIDRLARSLLIQGLSNDIYSLIDSNKTAKELWDTLARHMLGYEYGEQDRKAAVLYEYETFKAIEGELDVNDAMGLKKKTVIVTSDPLALIAEKTKIIALLAKAFNRRKFYSKPTNNNLRTSSTSQSASRKQEFVKTDDKKVEKKDDEKKRDISKVKCYNFKKEGHFAKDCKKVKVKDYEYYKTKMLLAKKDKDEEVLLTSSSSADDKIYEVSYYLSESESESEYETSDYYDNTTTYGLFVNNNDVQEIFYDCENFLENLIESQINHNESAVDHNDSKGDDKLIRKFNKKIVKCLKRIEKENQQNKDFENQNKDLQDKYDVFKNQATIFEMKNKELNGKLKVLIEKNDDSLAKTKVLKDQLQVKHVMIDTHVECQEKYAKLEAERYEYMVRYSAYFDNDKRHRKQIADPEVLYDKISVQLIELDKHVRNLKNTVLGKDFKIFTVYMIMPSKDTLYNGRKGIGFENPSYFEKAKDLRPSLYDEKVIGLGYTPMFLIQSDEALEIEKFKRARENKIEFAYDYGKKIIIDLEDEVVSLLEKEKANLETIKSLKSKGFESSENVISKIENQSENDCHVVEKECDNVENPKVIAPGMFKLSVSQSVSPISITKMSCASNGAENLDTFSSVRRPKSNGVIWKKKGSSNTSNVDLSYTSSAYVCNDAMNVSCNSRLCDSIDENNLFILDDESVRISPDSKMPFRKNPRDSMNVRSKSNSNKSIPRTVHTWLPKMQLLAEPVAKWIPKIVQICLWIIDLGCSKHMTGNRALLTNFVEKFLGTDRFGNNDFAVIAGYGDVVIGSMTIKKLYYVEGFEHNLFMVGQFCDKGLEVKAKGDIRVFVRYSKESAAFRIFNERTRKIHESVNVNFDEISEMASKQFSLDPGLSNLNKTGKSSNPSVSQVLETSKKDLEDLFLKKFDEYFDSSKIMKSSTMNVETSNVEVPSNEKEVFHQSDPKSSVRTRGQLANSCLFSCYLSSIEPANVAEALRDADWISAMQEKLDQFANLKVWRLVPRPKGKTIIKTKWIFKNKKDESSLVI